VIKKTIHRKWSTTCNQKELTAIKISNTKIILAILLALICALVYIETVKNMASIGAGLSTKDYTLAMSEYRMKTTYGDESLPFFAKQVAKLLNGLGIVFLYVFCYNITITKKLWSNAIYTVPSILYCYATLHGGNRASFMGIVVSGVTYWYIFNYNKNGGQNKNRLKLILQLIAGACLFLWFFSFARHFVGRLNETDLMSYITQYAGSSIQLLDLFIQSPEESKIFAQETFAGLHRNLSKVGLTDSKIMLSEFRESNGILIGNIYTTFRAYYQDFGILGIIIFQYIQAQLYTRWYEKLKHEPQISKFSISLVLYGMLMLPLFEHSIHEQLFSNYFCLNTLTLALIYYVLGRFFIPHKIKVT
jgi:oligosaccharide repeat unit polymerase